jgi:hypothetical protein
LAKIGCQPTVKAASHQLTAGMDSEPSTFGLSRAFVSREEKCGYRNHGEGVGVGLALAAANPGPILSSSPSSVPFTFL